MAVNLSPVGGVAGQFFDNNGVPLAGGKLYTYSAGTTTNQTTYTSAAGTTAHTNPIVLDSGGRVPGGEIWLTDGLSYKFVLKNASDVLIGTYDNIVGINSNFVNFLTETEVQTATAGQTVFTLTTMQYQPGTNNLTVYVDGVNQIDGSTYSYVETSATVVTFTAGLHIGALVKFTTAQTLSTGVTDASLVTYQPAGTGAVTTTVQAKLREVVSVMDFGAVADATTSGTGTDNTQAFINAIAACDAAQTALYVPSGNYLVGNLTFPASFHMFGDGRFQTNFIAKTGTTGIWFTDQGNAAKIDLNDFAMYGRNLAGMTYGLRLGYGTQQHGTEAVLSNLFVRDIGDVGAWGIDINGNVGIYQNFSIWSCSNNLRIIGVANMASNIISYAPALTGVELDLCDITGLEIEAPGDNCIPLLLNGNASINGLVIALGNGTTIDHLVEFKPSCTTWNIAPFNLAFGSTPASVTVTSGNFKRANGTFFGGNATGGIRTGEGNYSSEFSAKSLAVSNTAPQAAGIAFPSTQIPVADLNTLDDYAEYVSAAAACTGAVTASVSWSVVKVGKVVTLTLPVTKSAGVAVTSFTYGVVLPAAFRPATNLASLSAYITDNGNELAVPGLFFVNASVGSITVYREGTRGVPFTVTGQAGLTYGATLSWVVA